VRYIQRSVKVRKSESMSDLELVLAGVEVIVGVSQLYSSALESLDGASPSKSGSLSPAIREKADTQSIAFTTGQVENVGVEEELKIKVESPNLK
jgi:hypothetical protein